MERRWLRDNPHLPGRPPGRGVSLLQRLEAAAASAMRAADPAWRELRSAGFSTNQIIHIQQQLATWEQLDPGERTRAESLLEEHGALARVDLLTLRQAQWLQRWADRVRQTNASIAAVEVRIEERRADLARLHEAELAGDGPQSHDALQHAQAKASGAQEEIDFLCQRSRLLQGEIVQDFVAAGLESAPTLVHDLVREGLFQGAEVQEFRDLAQVIVEGEQARG